MTNDIQTIRTQGTYRDPAAGRPGQPDQDFESLLRRRTETCRADKAKADFSESRMVRKESEGSPRQDIREDTASLEAEKTGRSSGLKDDGQEDAEKEQVTSAAGYLVHDPSRQQASISPSLTQTTGQEAEDLLAASGQPGAVPLLEAGPADFAQRMKDDAVKGIPSISEDTLQRMEDPSEAVKAQSEKEGTGQTDTAKPGMTQTFLKSIQEAELRADSLKNDSMKKEALKPENLNRIAEEMKDTEKPGSISQNPMETRLTTDRIKDLVLNGKTREEAGLETSDKDAGMEGLKGLSSAVRTGEARLVQEAQKPEGQMAADRNLNLAATEIVHRVETLEDGDRTTIRVRLYPEEIGEMEITLSMEEGKLSGRILVENKEMRQVFTERLSELNQTLKACHIDVAKFEVGIGTGQHQDQARQQNPRQAAYPGRSLSYSRESSGMEERKTPGRTTARGIDLLA